MAKSKKPARKSLSKNKKAFHDYEILEKFEAGIVLNGDEVKSIRASQANLKGSFVDVWEDEAYMNEAHISRYKNSSRKTNEPTRKRKLLLKKRETLKIANAVNEKGIAVIPLELYLKGGLIKLELGIGRGKKLHDKRDTLKRRAQDIEINRQLKKY